MDRLARTLRPSAGFEDGAKNTLSLGGGTHGPGGLRTAGAWTGAPWGEARTAASPSQARLAPAVPRCRAHGCAAARFAPHLCLAGGDAGVVVADCGPLARAYRVDDDAAVRASGAGSSAAGDGAGRGGPDEGAGREVSIPWSGAVHFDNHALCAAAKHQRGSLVVGHAPQDRSAGDG